MIPTDSDSLEIRTSTFDFVVVMKGSVHLKLDSGEEKTLQIGDVILQKGANHAWTNPHPTEWARLYVVVTNALPIKIAGGSSEDQVSVLISCGRHSPNIVVTEV
jgi:hypothetical protein